jgi:hypothetical protein
MFVLGAPRRSASGERSSPGVGGLPALSRHPPAGVAAAARPNGRGKPPGHPASHSRRAAATESHWGLHGMRPLSVEIQGGVKGRVDGRNGGFVEATTNWYWPRASRCGELALSRRAPRRQLLLMPRVPAAAPNKCSHRPCFQDRATGKRVVLYAFRNPHIGPFPRRRTRVRRHGAAPGAAQCRCSGLEQPAAESDALL